MELAGNDELKQKLQKRRQFLETENRRTAATLPRRL